MRRSPGLLAAAGLAGALAGCVPFASSSSGDGGSSQYGFGQPTVLVTVNGVHFGPGAPDPGSGAQFANSRDGNGNIYQSRLRVAANSQAAQASCLVDVQRIGNGVLSIDARPYLLGDGSSTRTPDGQVDPVGTEAVAVSQGSWQCSGADCVGAGFALTALDATHIEGYASGVFRDVTGGPNASVVCSFFLPMLSYAP